jgi:tetratricopeptide (TPR) repeat protein
LVAATLLAYLPVWHGGFVWDDDSWTLNLSALFQQSAAGLGTIWRHPAVLPQYYPLTGTTFWLDYQLWKFWTTPYHIENVVLHLIAVFLFWRLLLRLQIRGAWLAAGLFALHPVMVESVAWITERKNVLSLVLYLGALLAYLRHAQGVSSVRCQVSRTDSILSRFTFHVSRFYGLALVLFLGALLAKTTTFSLPAVILLIGWWKGGRLRWRRDVAPTLPFFALSIGLCLVTAWLEKNHVGAQGSDFDLSWPQRCLVAGRVPWFYLGKLLWPANLCFVYPRWQPNPGVWWQWLHPVSAVGVLLALWLARGRIGRGPAAAAFFFTGTLFPVLGFMNAYYMRYSFVCDHWVYLSSLGLLAPGAALVARAAEHVRKPMAIYGFAAIVLPALFILTWRQCGMYADKETHRRTTIARNPNCWLAQSNLGTSLLHRGKPAEAETLYREALQLRPDDSRTQYNLGIALAAQGRLAEAFNHFERALQLNPEDPEAHYNLGVALASEGKWDEAIQHYERALQLKPGYAEAHNNLGIALVNQGKLAEAGQHFERALQLKPRFAEAHENSGNALAAQGKWTEAIQHWERALQLKPDSAATHYNLGIALAGQGKPAEAIQHFQQALALATAQGNAALAEAVRTRLKSYPPALLQPQTP